MMKYIYIIIAFYFLACKQGVKSSLVQEVGIKPVVTEKVEDICYTKINIFELSYAEPTGIPARCVELSLDSQKNITILR